MTGHLIDTTQRFDLTLCVDAALLDFLRSEGVPDGELPTIGAAYPATSSAPTELLARDEYSEFTVLTVRATEPTPCLLACRKPTHCDGCDQCEETTTERADERAEHPLARALVPPLPRDAERVAAGVPLMPRAPKVSTGYVSFAEGKKIEERIEAHFAGEPDLARCYETLFRVAAEISEARMQPAERRRHITDLAHVFSTAVDSAHSRRRLAVLARSAPEFATPPSIHREPPDAVRPTALSVVPRQGVEASPRPMNQSTPS